MRNSTTFGRVSPTDAKRRRVASERRKQAEEFNIMSLSQGSRSRTRRRRSLPSVRHSGRLQVQVRERSCRSLPRGIQPNQRIDSGSRHSSSLGVGECRSAARPPRRPFAGAPNIFGRGMKSPPLGQRTQSRSVMNRRLTCTYLTDSA
jgi:hypothetical protein